jgi:predicted nucleic acid-binding Zn ribbon protein
MSWNGDDTTAECPHCGASIYDDSERCPRCENYLSQEDATTSRPLWFIVCAVLCLLAALGWAMGR